MQGNMTDFAETSIYPTLQQYPTPTKDISAGQSHRVLLTRNVM